MLGGMTIAPPKTLAGTHQPKNNAKAIKCWCGLQQLKETRRQTAAPLFRKNQEGLSHSETRNRQIGKAGERTGRNPLCSRSNNPVQLGCLIPGGGFPLRPKGPIRLGTCGTFNRTVCVMSRNVRTDRTRYSQMVEAKPLPDQPYCHMCREKVDEWEQYVDNVSPHNESGYDIVQACPHCGSLCWEPSWSFVLIPFFLAWISIIPFMEMDGFIQFLVWVGTFAVLSLLLGHCEKRTLNKKMRAAKNRQSNQ